MWIKNNILAVCILVTGFYGLQLIFKRNDPAKGDARQIEVGRHMTMKQFIEQNNLEMGPRVPQGYAIDVDKLADWMPQLFDDNWIKLRVLDGDQSFELPPGRTLQITQRILFSNISSH